MVHSHNFRPDQLLLDDDPAFLPDILFAPLDDDFDLLDLNTGLVTDSQSTNTSSLRAALTFDDSQVVLTPGGLVLPTSDTGNVGGLLLQAEESIGGPRPTSMLGLDEDTALEGELFDFDADGNIHEPQFESTMFGNRQNVLQPSDATANEKIRQEHAAGQQAVLGARVY
jgi:meiotic recombination protein REC8